MNKYAHRGLQYAQMSDQPHPWICYHDMEIDVAVHQRGTSESVPSPDGLHSDQVEPLVE